MGVDGLVEPAAGLVREDVVEVDLGMPGGAEREVPR